MARAQWHAKATPIEAAARPTRCTLWSLHREVQLVMSLPQVQSRAQSWTGPTEFREIAPPRAQKLTSHKKDKPLSDRRPAQHPRELVPAHRLRRLAQPPAHLFHLGAQLGTEMQRLLRDDSGATIWQRRQKHFVSIIALESKHMTHTLNVFRVAVCSRLPF